MPNNQYSPDDLYHLRYVECEIPDNLHYRKGIYPEKNLSRLPDHVTSTSYYRQLYDQLKTLIEPIHSETNDDIISKLQEALSPYLQYYPQVLQSHDPISVATRHYVFEQLIETGATLKADHALYQSFLAFGSEYTSDSSISPEVKREQYRQTMRLHANALNRLSHLSFLIFPLLDEYLDLTIRAIQEKSRNIIDTIRHVQKKTHDLPRIHDLDTEIAHFLYQSCVFTISDDEALYRKIAAINKALYWKLKAWGEVAYKNQEAQQLALQTSIPAGHPLCHYWLPQDSPYLLKDIKMYPLISWPGLTEADQTTLDAVLSDSVCTQAEIFAFFDLIGDFDNELTDCFQNFKQALRFIGEIKYNLSHILIQNLTPLNYYLSPPTTVHEYDYVTEHKKPHYFPEMWSALIAIHRECSYLDFDDAIHRPHHPSQYDWWFLTWKLMLSPPPQESIGYLFPSGLFDVPVDQQIPLVSKLSDLANPDACHSSIGFFPHSQSTNMIEDIRAWTRGIWSSWLRTDFYKRISPHAVDLEDAVLSTWPHHFFDIVQLVKTCPSDQFVNLHFWHDWKNVLDEKAWLQMRRVDTKVLLAQIFSGQSIEPKSLVAHDNLQKLFESCQQLGPLCPAHSTPTQPDYIFTILLCMFYIDSENILFSCPKLFDLTPEDFQKYPEAMVKLIDYLNHYQPHIFEIKPDQRDEQQHYQYLARQLLRIITESGYISASETLDYSDWIVNPTGTTFEHIDGLLLFNDNLAHGHEELAQKGRGFADFFTLPKQKKPLLKFKEHDMTWMGTRTAIDDDSLYKIWWCSNSIRSMSANLNSLYLEQHNKTCNADATFDKHLNIQTLDGYKQSNLFTFLSCLPILLSHITDSIKEIYSFGGQLDNIFERILKSHGHFISRIQVPQRVTEDIIKALNSLKDHNFKGVEKLRTRLIYLCSLFEPKSFRDYGAFKKNAMKNLASSIMVQSPNRIIESPCRWQVYMLAVQALRNLDLADMLTQQEYRQTHRHIVTLWRRVYTNWYVTGKMKSDPNPFGTDFEKFVMSLAFSSTESVTTKPLLRHSLFCSTITDAALIDSLLSVHETLPLNHIEHMYTTKHCKFDAHQQYYKLAISPKTDRERYILEKCRREYGKRYNITSDISCNETIVKLEREYIFFFALDDTIVRVHDTLLNIITESEALSRTALGLFPKINLDAIQEYWVNRGDDGRINDSIPFLIKS